MQCTFSTQQHFTCIYEHLIIILKMNLIKSKF